MGVDCRVTATHPIDLHDGRVFGPGEKATDVDLTEPHNERYVDEGGLIPIGPEKELTGEALKKRAAELDIDGRSEMSAPQLRDAIKDKEKSL